MNRKHHAVIVVLVLIIVFLLFALGVTYWQSRNSLPLAQSPASTTTVPALVPAETLHLTEHATYYDIDLTYPSATPLVSVSASANDAAVAAMKAFAATTSAQFKQDGNFANLTHDDVQMMGLDQNKYSVSSEYKTYTGGRTVSYVFAVYEDTGGAHPNTYYRTFSFDTQTGAPLTFGDLFAPGSSYLSLLSSQARADVPQILAKDAGGNAPAEDTTYVESGTKPEAAAFQSFYIDGTSFVLVFPPYQVAPYSYGTILDPIPLTKLASALAPAYR